jgi:poly(beta-D-mannuronate) C5 epimerase
MLSLSRGLFTFVLSVLAAVFIFFHFHGAVSSAASALVGFLKDSNERVSATALNNNYSVTIKRGSPAAAIPPLPDISRFTVENIEAQAPPFAAGTVTIADMNGLPGLREFIKKDGRVQRLRLSQMAVTPQVIYIQSGHYDFAHLYDEVKALDATALEKTGERFILRLPILVGEQASLTISGKDAGEILLSQDQTVFIANAGDLFILRAKLTGWNEKEGHPALFKDRLIFRPFLVSWSGARMHIAGSTLASLGYRKGKSYGLTYSTCEPCLQVSPDLPRSTGSIIGNTFTDMYYGFYSYEADDIAIVGNKYVDNAIYGIDPHDRSRRLIIANNETSGSGKKHGIIISRNVNDSWIFNNYSHHNHGSGIMLDRTSENNVIANNISAYNAADGITFFESQNNTVYGNKIYQNGLSGIRIRNSWNIRLIHDQIADNGGVPVVVYSQNLEEGHKDRDLKEDPYTAKAGADLSGTIIKLSDSKPAVKIDGIESLTLSDVHLLSGGAVFSGRMFSDETDIRENMDTPLKFVSVDKKPLTMISQR